MILRGITRNGVEAGDQQSVIDGRDSLERSISLDPLFFYVPVINEENKCIELDKKLRTISLILRSVTDIIGIINIILQVLNGYTDKTSGEDFDPNKTPRWWQLYFLIDILVLLPFPQVIILIIFRELKGSKSLNKRKWLTSFVLFQYVPRVVQIYLSWKDPKRKANKLANKSPIWVKAAFNFFLYIIASHVLGAFWYFLSIERETACWHRACVDKECSESSFNCDHSLGNYTFLNDVCNISPPNTTPNTTFFDFGIFLGALQSGVVQSKSFSEKFFQCFWWGLRNLSSLGQNLQTSNYVWESLFTILISLFGLLLFSYFIGNLQLYMQSETKKSEEQKKTLEKERKKMEKERKKKKEEQRKKEEEDRMKMEQERKKEEEEERIKMEEKMEIEEKKRTIEIWMFKYRLPVEMKNEIMQNVDRRLERKKDVFVENLLRHLPEELRKAIKRYLCFDLLKTVPMLQNIDEHLLLMICDCLKPVYYNEHSYIVREGDPIDATFFIKDGIAWTYTSSKGEASGFSLAESLERDQFFGEELIELGLKTPSLSKLSKLPVSTRTVKTHGKIEAFALMAGDLKNIITKNWMYVGKEQSEPFAAYVVQAAWRQYYENKNLENSSQPRKGDKN
ncbi:cyclic nucleotide-gated ion channel 1 [Quercus suber]|uniref:cyclic nucleotide-gated ion channel 1 n=1 Tax=Quercus suber TaxID=58331 RepID=UPI0032DFBF0E